MNKEWFFRIIEVILMGAGLAFFVLVPLDILGYSFNLRTPLPDGVGTCTNSMEPEITCWCLELYKEVDPDNLSIGDIVVFNHNGKNYLHRIVDRCRVDKVCTYGNMTYREGHSGFLTKGDHLSNPDGCIPKYEIRAKMVWFHCLA